MVKETCCRRIEYISSVLSGDIRRDPTWDLVPLGVNVYFFVEELYFLVVKTIREYSF